MKVTRAVKEFDDATCQLVPMHRRHEILEPDQLTGES